MSEEIQNRKCSRCSKADSAHIGRDDMGIIVIHVMLCPDCYLVWKTTVEGSWFGKVGRR